MILERVRITSIIFNWVSIIATSAWSLSAAWAWGSESHRVVALITADRLTPATRAAVSNLVGSTIRRRMEEVSSWADEIRPERPKTRPWHYANIEISKNGCDTASDCRGGDCVVAQVDKGERVLADNHLAKAVRAEALRFLIHFVGDLHQPMHCGDNHDRRGNDVRVMIGGEEANLRVVWDTNAVAALGPNPDQLASGLEAQIAVAKGKAWIRGSPAAWANESFGIAKRYIFSVLAGEGGTAVPMILPRDYAVQERPIAAVQLEKAGVRLGALPNGALAAPNPAATETVIPGAAFSDVSQTVTIKGNVDDVYTAARSGVTFIHLGGRYPNNDFTAGIFSNDAGKFPDVSSLRGRTVEITGRVRLYKGNPEIILRSAGQIKAE